MIEDVKELERIILENQAKEIEVNGRKLVFGKFQEVKEVKNHFTKLVFGELSSLVTMILRDWNKTAGALFINIETPHKISVFTRPDKDLEREYPYCAEYMGRQFGFGKWYEYEDFIIALRSMFVASDERNKLLQLVSNVSSAKEKVVTDNGVTQTVQAKEGAILVEKELKAIYSLMPYRTFKEISQAESQYLFRITKVGEGLRFALFEADGGRWELAQKEIIHQYFAENLEGENIIIVS